MTPSSPPPEKLPLPRRQIVLRIVGGGLLVGCALMVALGSTLLRNHLRGVPFLLYWTACMLLACAVILVALWDIVLLRRISRHTRRELFRRQFMSGDLGDKSRDKENR